MPPKLVDSRILPSRFLVVPQGMGAPKSVGAAIRFLQRFIGTTPTGFVAKLIARHKVGDYRGGAAASHGHATLADCIAKQQTGDLPLFCGTTWHDFRLREVY